MTKRYKGSLTLEWYNKQKSIILQDENSPHNPKDIPAPRINWVNKDQALFYEIDETAGKGLRPYWMDRNDLRVKEARPLVFQKAFIAKNKGEKNGKPEYEIEESDNDDPAIENILIKGDNLLALNTLKKIFDKKPDEEKVKCIYIDPPYNTGSAFEHYDDNLEHSEWLTLMRDRFLILKALLSENGFIFVNIDEKEHAYIKILMDEIFGEGNFLSDLIWKKRKGGGNDSRFFAIDHDYIIVYAKNSSSDIHPQKYRIQYDEQYLKRYKETDDENNRYYWDTLCREGLQSPIIFDITCPDGTSMTVKSQKSEKVVLRDLKGGKVRFKKTKNGWTLHHRIYLNSNGKVLRSILNDVATNKNARDEQKEIFGEDNAFNYAKPEKLIETIFKFVTNPGDLVLDCFAGSGTTCAIAHKLGLNWIGLEIGNHADTHIIQRIKYVLKGSEQFGISVSTNFRGGGSFKYYRLGPSIINPQTKDFNWQLGRKFIEESLLSSYEYTPDTNFKISKPEIFPDESWLPAVGIQTKGRRTLAAIFSLNPPEENREFMTPPEISFLYEKVKAHLSPQAVTIFTNRGVELALDAKPDDLEIVKIPQAIFAELEV